MSKERLVICYTGEVPPGRVRAAAAEYAVEFVPLISKNNADVASSLSELQPTGYLVNEPGLDPPYLSAELIDSAANLEFVTYMGATLVADDYAPFFDLEALRARGIALTSTPGATISVAEGTLALLFALNLALVPANTARKAGRGFALAPREALCGSVLGIVGMGQIGTRVARLATALGMGVLYSSRHRHPDVEDELACSYVALGELFEHAQYVSIHSSYSLTRGIIGHDQLSRARGIALINTAHPPIVDGDALLEALEHGWVRCVAVEGSYDDSHDERLRSFGDERVLLLPFMSWNTTQSRERGWDAYLESLIAFLTGREITYRVL